MSEWTTEDVSLDERGQPLIKNDVLAEKILEYH